MDTSDIDTALSTNSEAIAAFLNTTHDGTRVPIHGVGSLDVASETDLSFCIYEHESIIRDTNAGAVICPPGIPTVQGKALIRSENPRLDFARAASHFITEKQVTEYIHPTAVIATNAKIGDNCQIGPHVYIGPDVTIGDQCTIQAGTSMGGVGFGFFPDENGQLHKQVHHGRVIIGDEVEVGSNCSIDRAVFDETVIGDRTKMDNLIHIAHNVQIGEDVWIADTVGVQGSVSVGNRVRIHPNASIADHVSVADGAEIGMNAAVLDDVEPGDLVVGVPAKPIR